MSYLGANPVVAQVDGYNKAEADALYKEAPTQNLIINGGMNVAQRGTSETGVTTSGYHTVDRWELQINAAGTWTMEQGSGLGPHGKSLKLTCTTADASLAAGDFIVLTTRLEGQDLQHLRKGTVDAEALSLGMLVKCDDTKTFVVELLDTDNSRHIAGTMTITSGGAEQEVSFTFDGDTSGVFTDDANESLALNIWLAAGSTFTGGTLPTSWATVSNANRAVGCDNLADAVNNYFEITGVQLEVGPVASDFVHESYDETRQKCLRYFERIGDDMEAYAIVTFFSTTACYHALRYHEKRAAPTFSIKGANSDFRVRSAGNNYTCNLVDASNIKAQGCRLDCTITGTAVAGESGWLSHVSGSTALLLDSEL